MPRRRRSSRSYSRRDLSSGYDDDRNYRESRKDRRDDRYYRESSRDRSSSGDDRSTISIKGSRNRRRSYRRQSSSYCSDEEWERDNRSRARHEERRARKSRKRSTNKKKLGPSRGGSGTVPLETRRQVQRRRNNNHFTKNKMSGIDNPKLKTTLEGDGLTIVDMASDGNCLFRAVSDQMFGDRGDRHDEIRSEICDFMEDKEDEFKMFLVFEGDEGKNNHDATDFESYIKDTRKNGVWGGNLELVAAARLYRRNITVYSATLDVFTIECDCFETSGADLLLSFHSGDHYNSVRPNAETKKPSRLLSSRGRKLTKGNSIRRSSSATVNTSSSATVNTSSTSTLSTSAIAAVTAAQEYAPENLNSNGQQNIVVATVVSVYDVPVKKNDPCPCGSGKRYKRCCPARFKEEQKEERRRRDRRERYDSEDFDRRSRMGRSRDQDEEDMVGGFKVLQI